jgi:predicted enzyme related to lactoylglutathione lyase
MRNPVGWFEIYVDDLDRAKAFYETVLGLPLSRLESSGLEMWAFPMESQAAGAGGALVKMPGVPVGGGSVLIYFSCDDCAVPAARVEKAGGQLQKPKTAIGEYGHIALVVDTEGNMVGLHSMQ